MSRRNLLIQSLVLICKQNKGASVSILSIMIYTGMFSPKEVPFPGFRYEKGGDFTRIIMKIITIIITIIIIIIIVIIIIIIIIILVSMYLAYQLAIGDTFLSTGTNL